MSDIRELVQDLLAHAHEAPEPACSLMRRAARELQRGIHVVPVRHRDDPRPPPTGGKHRRATVGVDDPARKGAEPCR